jgi:sec-independent protein translocase protein TatA
MLGLDNPIHIAFLLVLLLLVFGAKRLPEMGKSLGSGLRGFKDSLTGEETATPVLADAPRSIVPDPATTTERVDAPPAA